VPHQLKFKYILCSFCRHTKLSTIDSLPLCTFLKGCKENEPAAKRRKGSRSLAPPKEDIPALLKLTGRCDTRFAQTVGVYAISLLRLPLVLFSVIFPLLGCVKWLFKKMAIDY